MIPARLPQFISLLQHHLAVARQLQRAFEKVAQDVTPAVVVITCTYAEGEEESEFDEEEFVEDEEGEFIGEEGEEFEEFEEGEIDQEEPVLSFTPAGSVKFPPDSLSALLSFRFLDCQEKNGPFPVAMRASAHILPPEGGMGLTWIGSAGKLAAQDPSSWLEKTRPC